MDRNLLGPGITFTLTELVEDFVAFGVLTATEQTRLYAALMQTGSRLYAAPGNVKPLSKIKRATALGTLKLLIGVYRAAQALSISEGMRLDRIIQDAMARNAALHEFEQEDRR